MQTGNRDLDFASYGEFKEHKIGITTGVLYTKTCQQGRVRMTLLTLNSCLGENPVLFLESLVEMRRVFKSQDRKNLKSFQKINFLVEPTSCLALP